MALVRRIRVTVVTDTEQTGCFAVQKGEIHPGMLIQSLFKFGDNIESHPGLLRRRRR